ncbi:MAG: dual specificity protein phosphatase family protein [Candidatus Eisenbacteria bacterium]|nr:dual specificity protein phosphatase family protein [Candidatus Eisenbacteria bacterium]
MTEIYPNLFVGNESDYEYSIRHQSDWYVVHACKEPYHRRELGYTGRGAPRNHPEYLIARRENRLILNLVDAPNPAYIPKEIIDAALEFIDERLCSGQRVLVHCNLGESRAPAIGLLYMAAFANAFPSSSFSEAESAFRRIYPAYSPSLGIRGFLEQNWDAYRTRRENAT